MQNFKMQPLNKIILVLLDGKCCAMMYDSENICCTKKKIRQRYSGVVSVWAVGISCT